MPTREEAAHAAWEKERAIFKEMGLEPRPYPAGMVLGQSPEPIFNREIFRGIALGIEPEKKGYLFDFYKKEVQRVTGDITNFAKLMKEKYDLTDEAYLIRKFASAENELAKELGERSTELLRVMNTMTYTPRQMELFGDEKEVYRFAKHLHPKEE